MKVVIFCGGKGTRMREETEYRPKPLVIVGGKPIIWHIMKTYAYYGFKEFVLCVGYKGDMIKDYFMNFDWKNNDFTIDIKNGEKHIEYHKKEEEVWKVTIVDTGLETLTGGRLKKVKKYIDGDTFMLTYGDGLCDIDIDELIEFHRLKGTVATLTGIHPMTPFGVIEEQGGIAKSFKENPQLQGTINGGYMVLNKKIFEYIPDYDCMFEEDPLKAVTNDNQLAVFDYNGFWMSIDSFKDVEKANKMCDESSTPWKVW